MARCPLDDYQVKLILEVVLALIIEGATRVDIILALL